MISNLFISSQMITFEILKVYEIWKRLLFTDV